MAPSFRAQARLFVPAFAVHVAEEAPGFTAWAKRNASERYTQRGFVRNNALGFVSTAAATAAVIRSDNRTLQMAYYTVLSRSKRCSTPYSIPSLRSHSDSTRPM